MRFRLHTMAAAAGLAAAALATMLMRPGTPGSPAGREASAPPVDSAPSPSPGPAGATALRRSDGDPERATAEIRTLVSQGRVAEARAAAETFLRRYPETPAASEVARLTGVHPSPQGPP